VSKVKPILFSGPMVRALIEGRKTQTRRIAKRQDIFFCNCQPFVPVGINGQKGFELPYAPGNFLYVRETFATDHLGNYRYAATDDIHELRKKKPGIHLPRAASRLTLEVTGVKVERLQDITDDDAKAEGATGKPCPDIWRRGAIGWSMNWPDVEPEEGWGYVCLNSPRLAFGSLWNDINGEDAWNANPWVVAVTFAVHHQNVDAYLAQQKQVAA